MVFAARDRGARWKVGAGTISELEKIHQGNLEISLLSQNQEKKTEQMKFPQFFLCYEKHPEKPGQVVKLQIFFGLTFHFFTSQNQGR